MTAAADALMGIFGFKRVESAMKTIEQTRRELFEAWFKQYTDKGWSISKIATWEAFNAALDAVEIKLPSEVAQFADDDRGRRAFSLFTNTAIQDCRTAIESTNLGLKII